ncbi:triose-phosphate isomerase [Zavarzinia compransoris]|uniref:Triosephosphate isomerase n=1 Tax=Zavarzinia compransoris TaxID=1264899 RepID=A0A317EF63_9PROT|nr:triose-phosphate isomerase [Zavarzinia compransoris]PWR23815.1 triose-phosphate isomerase [Zavarzinia compransoris]TDP48048.1 triosephosphate isomerase [Zavarzinia compransoris]
MARRPFVAGNWKMNGLTASLAEIDALIAAAGEAGAAVDIAICPPATLVGAAALRAAGSVVAIGGQDCHAKASGAHTGDIAAEALKDAGAAHVIVGHSERRTDHAETDAAVKAKAEAAWRAGLVAIICVGETEAERDAGKTLDVIGRQLAGSIPEGATAANTVVAYEPVWAIGTGRTPNNDEIVEVHSFMRGQLSARFGAAAAAGIRLLYGGSVKPSNADVILKLADVDGALVGGASLKAADFLPIINAAR